MDGVKCQLSVFLHADFGHDPHTTGTTNFDTQTQLIDNIENGLPPASIIMT